MKWYCIHATCSCGETGVLQESKGEGSTVVVLQTSTAADSGMTMIVSLVAATVTWLALIH